MTNHQALTKAPAPAQKTTNPTATAATKQTLTDTHPNNIPIRLTRLQSEKVEPGPMPASALPPERRDTIWSRVRSISTDLSVVRDILNQYQDELTADDRNALSEVQAVYARISYVQSMYAKRPDNRRNRFLGR